MLLRQSSTLLFQRLSLIVSLAFESIRQVSFLGRVEFRLHFFIAAYRLQRAISVLRRRNLSEMTDRDYRIQYNAAGACTPKHALLTAVHW